MGSGGGGGEVDALDRCKINKEIMGTIEIYI